MRAEAGMAELRATNVKLIAADVTVLAYCRITYEVWAEGTCLERKMPTSCVHQNHALTVFSA